MFAGEVALAQQEPMPAASSALLPTVHAAGTFEWCQEVVECMNLAWRTRETAEQGFLAAVRAALHYRIWEILAPPFPEEPYGSLEGLIRRQADPGQAENMQIAIRFSGVLEEAAQPAQDDRRDGALPHATRLPEPAKGLSGQAERALTEEEE